MVAAVPAVHARAGGHADARHAPDDDRVCDRPPVPARLPDDTDRERGGVGLAGVAAGNPNALRAPPGALSLVSAWPGR